MYIGCFPSLFFLYGVGSLRTYLGVFSIFLIVCRILFYLFLQAASFLHYLLHISGTSLDAGSELSIFVQGHPLVHKRDLMEEVYYRVFADPCTGLMPNPIIRLFFNVSNDRRNYMKMILRKLLHFTLDREGLRWQFFFGDISVVLMQKLSKVRQDKAKICIIIPKLAKKYAKSSKNMLFFYLQNTCFA